MITVSRKMHGLNTHNLKNVPTSFMRIYIYKLRAVALNINYEIIDRPETSSRIKREKKTNKKISSSLVKAFNIKSRGCSINLFV